MVAPPGSRQPAPRERAFGNIDEANQQIDGLSGAATARNIDLHARLVYLQARLAAAAPATSKMSRPVGVHADHGHAFAGPTVA